LGVRIAICAAELTFCQGPAAAAQAAAEVALEQAAAGPFELEVALARRLLGRYALAQGDPGGALVHLRAALAMQAERGAALEAARTRLVLAEALTATGGTGSVSAEAHTLLTEAQAQFAVSGAALDQAQAAQVAAAWEPH
jgi:hypothetical protein